MAPHNAMLRLFRALTSPSRPSLPRLPAVTRLEPPPPARRPLWSSLSSQSHLRTPPVTFQLRGLHTHVGRLRVPNLIIAPLRLANAFTREVEVLRVLYDERLPFIPDERVGQRAQYDRARTMTEVELDMLITLAEARTRPFQIAVLHPRTGPRNAHQYVQAADLGVRPTLNLSQAASVLLDQFERFPSLSTTRIAPNRRSAVLNLDDNVSLSLIRDWQHRGYRIFLIEAVTQERHALAGQLNHMLFQHLDTGRTHIVRFGVGHLVGLNTPGAGLADHINDYAGAYAWVLASRFAVPLLNGDRAAIERLERHYGLAHVFFTFGGILSRDVIQPIQRYTFPRTEQTILLVGVACLITLQILFCYAIQENEGDEPPEPPWT